MAVNKYPPINFHGMSDLSIWTFTTAVDQSSVISLFQRISFRNDTRLLLADRHILTSAHCIEAEEMVTVQIGAPDENQYTLSGIPIPHPNYDTWSSVNDIALIELEDSIEFGSKSI